MCTLFLDPDLDDCARDRDGRERWAPCRSDRERGLGQGRGLGPPLRRRRGWAAELITVPADADDWPQLLYHRARIRARRHAAQLHEAARGPTATQAT